MSDRTQHIQNHFNKDASVYDERVRRHVPGYDHQHGLLVQLATELGGWDAAKALRVLDLGCGPGTLSGVILKAFPAAHVVGLDLSENMLAVARENLAAFGDRFETRQGDFGATPLEPGYDLVVSGLAIHHLTHEDKQALYRRIYEVLTPGGLFFNRDILVGPTERLTVHYENLWKAYVDAHGGDSQFAYETYKREDLPATVDQQIAWLREACFTDVDCFWRQWNFALFGGRK